MDKYIRIIITGKYNTNIKYDIRGCRNTKKISTNINNNKSAKNVKKMKNNISGNFQIQKWQIVLLQQKK